VGLESKLEKVQNENVKLKQDNLKLEAFYTLNHFQTDYGPISQERKFPNLWNTRGLYS